MVGGQQVCLRGSLWKKKCVGIKTTGVAALQSGCDSIGSALRDLDHWQACGSTLGRFGQRIREPISRPR